jgi:hypothetical protein
MKHSNLQRLSALIAILSLPLGLACSDGADDDLTSGSSSDDGIETPLAMPAAPAIGVDEGLDSASVELAFTDSDVSSDDGSVEKANGCSIVQFCQHPDTGGTMCIAQSGCSCEAARNECAREAVTVCGTPRQPFLIQGGQCGFF